MSRRHGLVPLGYLALTVALFAGAWSAPTSRWIGRPGDPAQLMWFLRWVPRAVARGENPLVTHHLNAPDGVNLMWNTAMPLAGLVLGAALRPFGAVLTYNALLTIGVAGSAVAGWWAARSFVRHESAAVVAGLVFGLSPFMQAHARQHVNWVCVFLTPVFLILLREIFVLQRQPARRAGLALGLLTAAQVLLNEELMASIALVALVAVVLLCALHRRGVRARARHALVALGVAAVVAGVVLAWPLTVQFAGPERVRGDVQLRDYYVTDVANLVVPTAQQVLARDSWSDEWTGNGFEKTGYLGVPLLVALVWVIRSMWRRHLVRFLALLLAAVVVLSLGPQLHVDGRLTGVPLPMRALQIVPLMGHVLPARLMVHAYLLVALLLAIGLDAALASGSRRRVRMASGTALLALLPLAPGLPFESTERTVPRFFTAATYRQAGPDPVLLVAPFTWLDVNDSPMLWQQESGFGFRMPTGYFNATRGDLRPGPAPSVTRSVMLSVQAGNLPPVVDDDLRRAITADLVRWEVDAVVVGPMPVGRANMEAVFRFVFGIDPERTGGVAVWWLTRGPPSA